ncbi:hypothetical protein ACHWQZ_G005407 [Mnemiopsis leidyi]
MFRGSLQSPNLKKQIPYVLILLNEDVDPVESCREMQICLPSRLNLDETYLPPYDRGKRALTGTLSGRHPADSSNSSRTSTRFSRRNSMKATPMLLHR